MTLRDIKTFIIKQKNTIGLILGAVFLFVTTDTVYAASFFDAMTWIGSPILTVFNGLLYLVLQFLVSALLTLVGILIQVGQFRISMDSPVVDTGWLVVRDISNMFFVVILLLISFGTILRLDQYQLKNLLPKVILMAVVVNFSKLIVGFFIEISQVIMLTFVAAYSLTGAGNFIEAFKIPSLAQISGLSDYRDSQGQEITASAIFGAILGGIIYTITANVVVLAFLVIFIVRIVALWVLAVFSPLAFVLGVVPGGNQYASQWWGQFTKYLTIGPVLAFFLWLSLATLPGLTTQSTDGLSNKGLLTEDEQNYLQIPGIAPTDALQPISVLHFLLSTAMLVMSLYLAQSVGGVVGSAARMGMSSLSTIGKNMGGIRPGLRYWDERRAGNGKKSLNAAVYWDAWKGQREETRRQRMTQSVGYAQALAKQGFGKAALGYVGNRMFGETLKEGVDEDGKELKRLGVTQAVGAGLDVASRQKKYKKEFDDAKRAATAANAELSSLDNYTELKMSVDAANGRTDNLTKEQKDDYAKFQKIYGDLSNQELQKERIRLEDESKKADATLLDAKNNIDLKEEQIAARLKTEAQDEIKATNAEIVAIGGGYMDSSEVKDAINNNSQEIKKFEDLIKRLAMMGGSEDEERVAEAKLQELRSKQTNLESYRDDMQRGDMDVSQIASDSAFASLVASQKTKEEQDQRLDQLKFNNELARIRAEGKPLTDDELSRLKSEELKVKSRQRDKRVKLAKMQLPLYYQEKARRNMVGEKLKELAGIEDSDELIQIFEKAEAEKDQYMQMAVANKLAGDGNHNDLLNHYGYGSGFEGFQQFYAERITKNFGGDDKAKDAALRLARDISYVAESRNHWDQSRVVKVDASGKMAWASEDEHVAMVMNEIKKLNPQKVKREFNRLAVGGEEILANGDVRFIWGKLAQAFLESQYDNIYSSAGPGGDLQKNLAENLLKGLNSLPYDQLVRDGFVKMQKKLDEYVNNPRLAETKK